MDIGHVFLLLLCGCLMGAIILLLRYEAATSSGYGKCLKVYILNPLEVAANEHPLGKKAGAFAPSLLKTVVYKRVITELQEELAERGIQADIVISKDD